MLKYLLILSTSEGGTIKVTYHYDELNELIREDNVYQSQSITYTYDAGGNITAKTQYAYTTGKLGTPTHTDTYAYGDSNWTDKLTSYDNSTITYDNIGNPLTYINGLTFTWQNGRELATAGKTGTSVSYKYDDSSIRTQKTVNSVATNYYLNGDKIVAQISGSTRLDYLYDEKGDLFGFTLTNSVYTSGANFYHVRNGQNNIIGILDSSGTQVVTYTYDTWGKLLSTSGSLASTVGALNPFCYRGYYYDSETGLCGREEIDIIVLAVEKVKAQGINAMEPFSADTIFIHAFQGKYDAVVTMFHDQGHIPLKVVGFTWNEEKEKWDSISGVNITLGLPIIRSSVDHGTAFDQAGRGSASELSLMHAIEYGVKLAENR